MQRVIWLLFALCNHVEGLRPVSSSILSNRSIASTNGKLINVNGSYRIAARDQCKCASVGDRVDFSEEEFMNITNASVLVSSIDSLQSEDQSIQSDIIRVALPALAACIAEPLLTMVDSYFLGKNPSLKTVKLSLASMAVNGAIFNIISAITSPLCTGTTALVSAAKGHRQNSSIENEVQVALYNGIFVSLTLGFMILVLLLSSKDSILSHVFGLAGDSKSFALDYLFIRALSMPSALLNLVIIGFSLGVQESVAPALSIVSATLINVFCDYLFIMKLNWGIKGAALATTIANYIGGATALSRLIALYGNLNASDDKKNETPILTTYFSRVRELIDFNYLKRFFSASSLLLAGTLINTFTYSSTSRIASIVSSKSLTNISAHQIAIQLWWFLSFFSTPLSLVAQAVLPRDIESKKFERASKLMSKLRQISIVLGIYCGVLNGVIPLFFPNVFTIDSKITSLVNSVVPQMVISQTLICVATVMDGICIGRGNLKDYILASILSTVSAWIVFSHSIVNKLGLVGAWNGLLTFTLVRFLFHSVRLKSTIEQLGNE